jgi:hypothetical protein
MDFVSPEEAIERARALLPLPSDDDRERIRIGVQKQPMEIWMEQNSGEEEFPYYIVEFRKHIVDGIVVGWECTGHEL